ncbi:MAG: type II secretion system minor pseudopilin GspK [Desulfatibacillaceae bacterium]
MKRHTARDRGIVLVVTLMVIAILVTAAIEANRKVRHSLGSTGATRIRHQLGWMACSGVEIAKAVLVEDRLANKTDTIQDIWADDTEIAKVMRSTPFEEGVLSLEITDLLGRIQINALVEPPNGHQFDANQKNLVDRFLRPIIDETNPDDINLATDIINSIKDWMDKNDDDAITGINGAESDYYLDLDPPYECRNDFLDHKGQLVLVKGITREMYQGLGGAPGISDFITEYGSEQSRGGERYPGKINIGTCSAPVLKALLPVENEDLAESILAYRHEKDGVNFVNDITAPAWYRDAPGAGDVEIPGALLTYESQYFEVKATATADELKRTVKAVLYREKDTETGKWTCTVLSWHVG